MNQPTPVPGLVNLVNEIKKCEEAGATAAALAMAFICIDTMAFLSLPANRVTQTRADFVAWVDTYLKGHPEQPYQYRGLDVYGARCALLHAFGSEGNFHTANPDAKVFGYHDGGRHAYDPAVNTHYVVIGTASFLNDVVTAVAEFLQACVADPDQRARLEARLPNVLATFPVGT